MDTTVQNIIMNREAKEVQAIHKPQAGDYYVCECKTCIRLRSVYIINGYDMDAINKRDLSNVMKSYRDEVDMADIRGFPAFYREGHYIWLPRQDQLQAMLWQGFDEYEHWVSKLYNFILDLPFKKMSMEQLWLAFVMNERFLKTWNGKQWV